MDVSKRIIPLVSNRTLPKLDPSKTIQPLIFYSLKYSPASLMSLGIVSLVHILKDIQVILFLATWGWGKQNKGLEIISLIQ
jgi:hypothetical protein